MTRRVLSLVLVLAAAAAAQSSPITVVNAASYQSAIAPDSLASIFGTSLARSTASATLDAAGQLPVELASTRVDVNGQAASLVFVSPAQINFVVPGGIGAGSTTLTIRYTDTSSTRSATVTIAAAAPALFSSDASGSGPGAILNAVTFAAAPFLVETTGNSGDNRTRLALYGTGIRYANDAGVTAADSRGNRYSLTVEYAGAAPGFFGLDQVNVVLPPDLDGGGAVSLTVTTDSATSNTVTAQINLLPAGRLNLAGITLAPTFVPAGDPIIATVSLNGVARAGGFNVALRSTSLAAQPQALVTIAEGRASAQSTIATNTVTAPQTGSIQASALGVTRSADFEVDPANAARLSGFSLSAASVLGGRTVTGAVSLTANAPPGGANIQIASGSAAVHPPAVVNVPFNQLSATFPIATDAVTASVSATLTATLGRTSLTAPLSLLPPISLTVDQASVTGGANITLTIKLAEAAPAAGAQIQLKSTDASLAQPPSPVTIPAGQNTATATITTGSVTTARTVTISAAYQGFTQSVAITVNPQPVAALSSVTVSPSTVTGGTSVQGTVTLTAPAGFGGLIVQLSSSVPSITLLVPSPLAIPQGSTTGRFTITTTSVIGGAKSVTITATAGGVSKTAVLIIQ